MTTTQIKNNRQGTTAAPSGASFAAVAGGGVGTFNGATAFFWKVSATGPFGESIVSAEVTGTPATSGHAEITATFPAGTTGYRLYRGASTGAENLLVSNGSIGPGANTVWDTGVAGVSATPPTTAALTTVTKTTSTAAKSSLPSVDLGHMIGTQGQNQFLYAALQEWLSDAASATSVPTTTQTAARALKMAAAAGFLLQET